jgi:hypothetical protein
VRQQLDNQYPLSGVANDLFDADENSLLGIGWTSSFTSPAPVSIPGLDATEGDGIPL